MSIIRTVEELEALYGVPSEPAIVKETPHLTAEYRAMVEASPFALLATSGPEGLDCSPRGDKPGFVRVHDDRTLLIPDRRGNNRVDSLRNIVRDPRIGLLFLIPGAGNTLRVNGQARVSIEPTLLQSFAVDGKAPRSVLVIAIDTVYFQCSRAIIRSDLWSAAAQVNASKLPSPGQILAALTAGKVGGDAYDREWPARARSSLW